MNNKIYSTLTKKKLALKIKFAMYHKTNEKKNILLDPLFLSKIYSWLALQQWGHVNEVSEPAYAWKARYNFHE